MYDGKVVAIHHLGGHHRGWYLLARIEAKGFIWKELAEKKFARTMLASKCLPSHEKANIAMDYPALNAAADYPPSNAKNSSIYIPLQYVANLGDKKNKKSTLKLIDWYLSDCLPIKFNKSHYGLSQESRKSEQQKHLTNFTLMS